MLSWFGTSKDDDEELYPAPDVTSESMTTEMQHTSLVAQATPSRLRTWKTAFEKTCLQNGTIHVSIIQVLEEFENIDANEIPTASKAVLWSQEGTRDKLVQRFQSELTVVPKENQVKKATKSSVFSTLYKAGVASASFAKSATKPFWQSADDFAMEKYGADVYVQEESDNEQEEAAGDPDLSHSESILNVDLAVDCLHFLRDTITQHAQQDESERILVLAGGPSSAALACQEWIGRLLSKESFGQSKARELVQKMASKELQFLMEVLMDCGVVEILKRRPQQEDLLFFCTSDDASSKEFKLAMFDLNRQVNRIQKRIDTMSQQRDECEKAALLCRKAKKESQAMKHMRLRQQLSEQIGLFQNTLHNLESQRFALESAASNREILQVSQRTAKVLKDMRHESEDAEEVISDLQDEFDSLQVVQDTLAHTADVAGIIDEDELLAELEALNIDDPPNIPPREPVSESTAATESQPASGIEYQMDILPNLSTVIGESATTNEQEVAKTTMALTGEN